MTKIVESWVTFRKEPLRESFSTSLRSVNELTIVEFHIKTDAGHEVFGETVETPAITGDTLNQIVLDLSTTLAEALIGSDFEGASSFFYKHLNNKLATRSAKSAVDIALYELEAAIQGKSLKQVLDCSVSDIDTDITVPLTSIDEIPQILADRQEFSCFKIKLGIDSLQTQIAKIALLRDISGAHARIRVDPNQAWSVEESIEFLKAADRLSLNIEYLEQPISASNKSGLARIRSQSSTKIMADESILTVEDLEELLSLDAVDLVNIKIIKSGGITPALEIIERAKAFGMEFSVGTMMEGDKGILAAFAIAGAQKPDYCHDLDAAWWASNSGFSYSAGKVSL